MRIVWVPIQDGDKTEWRPTGSDWVESATGVRRPSFYEEPRHGLDDVVRDDLLPRIKNLYGLN